MSVFYSLKRWLQKIYSIKYFRSTVFIAIISALLGPLSVVSFAAETITTAWTTPILSISGNLLTWTAAEPTGSNASSPTAYQIYRSSDPSFPTNGTSMTTVPSSVLSYTMSPLYDDYNDYYRIRATKANTIMGEYSNTVQYVQTNFTGQCGDYLTWSLNTLTGSLVINGTKTDDMWDYAPNSPSPWHSHKDKITTVYISPMVRCIGDYAFAECQNLTSVTFSNSDYFSSVGKYAFANCISLHEIDIPPTVNVLGQYAFTGCSQLEFVSLPLRITKIAPGLFLNCASLSAISMHENIVEIGDSAFSNCTGLTDVKLSSNITKIDQYAFSNCTKLPAVLLPSKLQFIGANAFRYNRSLQDIIIPSSVTTIDEYAFQGCWTLSSITFEPSDISTKMTIKSYAFNDCNQITSLVIPSHVSVGTNSFSACQKLEQLELQEGVTSILQGSFSNNNNLSTILLPTSLTWVSHYAFYNCNNITNVYYAGSPRNRESIDIGSSGNQTLIKATWHYELAHNYSLSIVAPSDDLMQTVSITVTPTVVPKSEPLQLFVVTYSSKGKMLEAAISDVFLCENTAVTVPITISVSPNTVVKAFLLTGNYSPVAAHANCSIN